MRLSAKHLFRSTVLVFIILMLLSLPLGPYTSAEPCAILKVSLLDGTYAGPDVDSWLDECWLLNLTGFSQTFVVRINNTSAVKRSYDTHLVIALNDAGYNNLQSLVVNGTSVPRSAFRFEVPEPYGLWDWPSGDVYPTWYEDTYVNVGTIYRRSYNSVVVTVIFSDATGVRMHFDAYGSTVSDTLCYSGYITHNGISEDSTVLLNAGAHANQPPTASFFYTPSYPTSYESVTFNASGSYDPDGYIASYRWDFGDGTPVAVESDPIAYHTYTNYGNYTVQLTVTDDDGLTDDSTSPISIRQRPVAAFDWSPLDPLMHEEVTFDASDSTADGGVIVSYEWDFGDGNTTTMASPIITHTYATYGVYMVTLNVTDSEGKWDTEAKPITVENLPMADFWWIPTSPMVCENVTFDASISTPDGGILISYAWDFGDGTPIVTENGPIIIHHYIENGTFTVTLNVTDSEGRWDTESKVITVNPRIYYLTVKTDPLGILTIPGNGWYDNNTYVNLDASAYMPDENGDNGQRYRFDYWDVDGSAVLGNPIDVLMTANHTATAHYVLQCLITFAHTGLDDTSSNTVVTVNDAPKSFSDLPFLLWVDSGSSISYDYNSIVSSAVPGKRFALGGIDGPPLPFIVTGPETVTGHYRVQHYLTLTATTGGTTNPPSGGWYDAGSPVAVLAIPDLDYVLDHWELDGTSVGSDNPYNVLMDSAHALHVVFEYSPPPPRYYLTVKTAPLNITPISGEGWYDEGSNVTLTAPDYVEVSTGTRYRFDYWDVDGVPRGVGVTSTTVHVDANHTATAYYTLQYYFAVTSPYDTPTPASGWFNAGASITASVTSPWAGSAGSRYVCVGWTGMGSVPASGTTVSVGFTINAPSSITWNWKTQYYLTVRIRPPGITTISGEGWYDASANVPLTAPIVRGYNFLFWDIDGFPRSRDLKSISVTMDVPHTATANYESVIVGGVAASIKSPSLTAWVGLNTLLIAAILVTASWVKRQRRKAD